MNLSMLWGDNSQTALKEKIEKAATYFQKKYGKFPDLCLVSPKDLADTKLDCVETPKFQVIVRPWHPVIPGSFYIGVDETPEYVGKPGEPAGEKAES